MSNQSSTYQARIVVDPEIETFLDAYANHYNFVEHTLYADMRKTGNPAASFKNDYLIKHGLTARQFNAIGRNLEGKIDSVLKLLSLREQETKIKLEKEIKALEKLTSKIKTAKKNGINCDKAKFSKHQKSRRIAVFQDRLAKIEQQETDHDARICFGSRELFRKQFNHEINGYANHAEWQKDWQAKRSSQFYVLGSGDEESGCQGCLITKNPDGTFSLKLRSLGKTAEYLILKNIDFKYGADVISAAIVNNVAAKSTRSNRDSQVRQNKMLEAIAAEKNIEPTLIDVKPAVLGQALSYRFIRNGKGWRVMITTDAPAFERVSVKCNGMVGLDINADCIAMAETDRFGNLVKSKIIKLVTYGKSSDQAEALICEVAKQIVNYAVSVKKPICMEKLDFKNKKAALSKENPKQSRMLSSLSYNKIIQAIKSRAYRFGIVTKQVNPAYTSIIGLVNYSKNKGISVHQAAAFVIARRGSDCRELPNTGVGTVVPTPKGDHVAFVLPVRNRTKHIWKFWTTVKTIHTEVLAAHFRPPQGDPLLSGRQNPKRKCPNFTVRPRNSNRQQNCLVGVMDDIPW
jgi:IS605 OrfB family transposase